MEIKVTRKIKTGKSTIGDMTIDGKFECNTLEDIDRKLVQSQDLNSINKIKVHGDTAIPTGKYQVIIDHSDHFSKDLPHILNVPGFEGIRIHSGNVPADTEGCILLGTNTGTANFISNSRDAFNKFYPKLQHALTLGKVYIIIE